MPPELPLARPVHHLPGRLRLRVEAKRGDRDWFDAAAVELATLRDVEEVASEPRTGSLLVRYRNEPAALLAEAEARGLFRLDPAAAPEPAAPQVERALRRLARGVGSAEWVAAALLLAALVQVGRGNVLPPAVSLLAYAASVLVAAERDQRPSRQASAVDSQGEDAASPPT